MGQPVSRKTPTFKKTNRQGRQGRQGEGQGNMNRRWTQVNANRFLSASIGVHRGGHQLPPRSSVVSAVPSWFNSHRISLANLGVLGGSKKELSCRLPTPYPFFSHSTSVTPAAWLAYRARTNNRSPTRLRYCSTVARTGAVSARAHTSRSARRQTARATCRAALAGVPPGRIKVFSGSRCCSNQSIEASAAAMSASSIRIEPGAASAGLAS